MKKLFLPLLFLCLSQIFVGAQTVGHTWNFSVNPWWDNPELWSTTTIDGLTVHATESYPTIFTTDYKTSAYASFKQAMVLSGIPTQWDWIDTVPMNYAVSFEMSGPGNIEITALSATQEQSLLAIKGKGDYQEFAVPQTYSDPYGWGTDVPVYNTYYNGNAGRVYIYPSSGNLKLYQIKVDNVVVPVDTNLVTFNVVVPRGTHQCWVVGDYSDWNTSIGQMHMVDSTHYTLTLPLDPEEYATQGYKYLSGPGNWAFVEKDINGFDIPNRTWTPSDTVASWGEVFNPETPPVEKDLTLEVYVPLAVNTMYVTGSFKDWQFDESNKMNLVETGDYWKKFSLTIHTLDANYLAYKFSAGPGWEFSQTEDMEFHYADPTADVASHYLFGYWQYLDNQTWTKDWYMDNFETAVYTQDSDLDGIQIYAEAGYPVSLVWDSKNYEQFNIEKSLHLPYAKFSNPLDINSAEGGGISIGVGGSCQISVICFSNASTTGSANLYISNGEQVIGSIAVADAYADPLQYQVFNYTGDAGKLYFYTNSPEGVDILYLATTHFSGEMHEEYLTYTVEVPSNTMQVFMAGDFNNWEPNHWMDRIDSTHFSTTLWNVNKEMQYKFCAGNTWDFRELTIDGQETANRTWSEMDKVERWANVFIPTFTRIYTEPVTTSYLNSFEVKVKSESNENRQPISYQFTFWYDPWMMEYEGYDVAGTVSEAGQIVVNPDDWNGRIYVSFMSTQPIDVNGELLRLKFKSTSWGETWPNIGDFYYNSDYIWDTYSHGFVNILYYQEGDVDGNFMIQAYDAALSLQYSVGMDPLPAIDPLPWEDWRMNAADVDNVEGITANDASMILQYSAHMIYSFEPDTMGWKTPAIYDADVLVSKENNNLEFRSMGNLMGFNLYVNEHSEVLGTPVISEAVSLSAVNNENGNYAVGVANVKALKDSTVFMIIPIKNNDVEMISLNMIVNTTNKDIKEAILTNTNDTKLNSIQIYPNPVTDHLIISDIIENSRITIYDITGKLIYQETLRNDVERISVDGWNPGVYTVRIHSNEGSFTSKFVKK